MYEFMCAVWQLVGSVVGLLLLVSLIGATINSFRTEEEVEDDN